MGTVTLFRDGLLDALENWEASDIIKVAVLDSSNSPSEDDAAPELGDYTEVGTAGTYPAGGTSIGTWGNFITRSAGVIKFSATPPNFTQDASNDNDARYFLYYNDTQAGDPCFAFVDMGANYDMTADDLSGAEHESGLATITIN